MLTSLRPALLCLFLLTTSWRLAAQPGAGGTYWFEMQGGKLLLKSAAGAKPVTTPVTLPNGTQLDYRSNTLVLADGSRRPLRDGDMVSLNGTVTTAPPPPPAASPAPAPESAPAPKPAETATAPAVPVAPATPAPVSPSSFSFTPAAPVNGRLKGVVELGASGFNSFIINVDNQKRWQLRKAEFGHSLVMENMATDADVRTGLKAYISDMLSYGVGGRDIYFVVSSGAMKAAVIPRIIKSLKELGYVVNPVTPEREGELGLRAAIPTGYEQPAFVVDMGSANTKISWYDKGQPKSLETYGSKYYEGKVPDIEVANAVREKARQVPAEQRVTCFVLGGVPYELAKRVRKGKEPYTVLAPPATYSGPEAKLNAGLNIYRALAEATGCQRFVFVWDANFTIGYLLTR